MKTVSEGWGYELWIANKEYCGKFLYFYKGKKFSWQYHINKEKTYYVQSGKITIKHSEQDDISKAKEVSLTPGMSFNIERKMRHRIIALENSEVFEFGTEEEKEDVYILKRETK